MIMNTNIDELTEMRTQLSDFKSELRQQKIFNEKILRKAMAKDYSKERNTPWTSVIISIIAIPILIVLAYFTKVFPVWFIILTVVFLLASISLSFYRTRRFVSDDTMKGNVLTVAQNLADCKRFDNRSLLFFSLPVIVIWAAAFFFLMLRNGGEFARAMAFGGAIGCILGGVLGAIYVRDSSRRIDRILAQIEELRQL
jgi:glucan phosphoethanolaminetransferase (alkaline phosphatase superfamily)